METINFKFMIEKREGYGEDSDPLFITKDDNFCAVGVFDGMGGSGAATCKSEFGDNHTKAYVASRIIKEAVFNYIEYAKSASEICADGIQSRAKSRLEQEKSNYNVKPSGLRSTLVREYPTTLAVITCEKKDDGSFTVNSYWAGDSRNYVWNSKGFFQISKDDLDSDLDPLENLRNDGALSNCVCEDRNFRINSKLVRESGPFVIFSATDGCFGYFPTPMHFHHVLLAGLKLSNNETEWADFIKNEICKVTGDDISLSLCAVGYENFNSLKVAFENEIIDGFDELESLRNEIAELETSIVQKKSELEEKVKLGWDCYKSKYLELINTQPEDEILLDNGVKQEVCGVIGNDNTALDSLADNTTSDAINGSCTLSTEASAAEEERNTEPDKDNPVDSSVKDIESIGNDVHKSEIQEGKTNNIEDAEVVESPTSSGEIHSK